MATEDATIDQVGGDVAESTSNTVSEIGTNLGDTASEIGGTLKQTLLNRLTSNMEAPKPGDVPVPDIAPEPLAEQGHQAMKDAAAEQAPEAPGTQTTLRDQLKQAEEQFAKIG